MRPFAFAFVLIALSPPARAQPAPAPACTYSTCALRVESGFFGSKRLVRGAEGRPAGRITLFTPDLTRIVAASPRAVAYARSYERTRTTLAFIGVGAAGLLTYAYLNVGNGEAPPRAALGAVGLALVAIPISGRSNRALSRAVWQYNRELPR